ncbi:MAG: hypothetical protein HZA15_13470, partial [Nitrospirae bacterium]|nr:hypothetical protein [Nitrospirota bacterium]
MGSAVPARSLDRAREYWRQHGRSAKWIQQRMMGQETRNKLTDYWKDHEIKGEDEYTRASAWQASRFRKGRWPNMKKTLAAWAVASIFLLGGCASTQVEFTGAALKAPLCQTGAPPVATAFYWGPQWRPDQKEPDLREA